MRAYSEYILEQVAQRRGGTAEDLVSLIVNADDEQGPLSDIDLIFETMLVLVGGDETTRHVISGGVEALLRHPDELARLRAEPELLPGAIEEMLRWVSPIRNMNRTATVDAEVHGQQVKEGDRILLLYPSANRDEKVFDDPYRFDITRSPNDHVSFGGFGRHHCLGAPLARLELRVLFEELLARLPDLELATDDELPTATRQLRARPGPRAGHVHTRVRGRRLMDVSTPSAQGVDPEGIAAFLDALEHDPRIEPHGLIIQRHGQRIVEGYWAPHTGDRSRLVYSLSKTFTGTALALQLGEGRLALDDLVSDHLPELLRRGRSGDPTDEDPPHRLDGDGPRPRDVPRGAGHRPGRSRSAGSSRSRRTPSRARCSPTTSRR